MNAKQLKIGTWISAGSPAITELISQLGFDWLLFDLEHGMMSEAELLSNIQATQSRVKIIVRVGDLNPSLIAKVLDLGVDGIMLPHVNSPLDAEQAIRAMRYPPKGNRSFSGSCRAFGFGSRKPADITKWQPPLFIAQIETHAGVINAEKIAEVEGVDMLFTGPSDLKINLSIREPNDTLSLDDATKRIAYAGIKSSCPVGIIVRNFSQIQPLKDAGYNVFAYSSDMEIIRNGYKELFKMIV